MDSFIGIIAGVLGILISLGTIAGVVFALGKRDSKLDNLEVRQNEDRATNKEQHQEFYKSKYLAETTDGNVSRLEGDMKEIKGDIKTILARLPERRGGIE